MWRGERCYCSPQSNKGIKRESDIGRYCGCEPCRENAGCRVTQGPNRPPFFFLLSTLVYRLDCDSPNRSDSWLSSLPSVLFQRVAHAPPHHPNCFIVLQKDGAALQAFFFFLTVPFFVTFVFLNLLFSSFQHHLLERHSHQIYLRGAAHLLCNLKVSPEELFDNEQSSREQWCTPVTFMWFENCSMKGPPSFFPSAALCSSLKCVDHRMFAETARSGLVFFSAFSSWLLLLMHLTGPGFYL